MEHGRHVRHLRGIPRSDILVERGSATEHVPHVRYLRGIPRRDIRVELGGGDAAARGVARWAIAEQLRHVRHLRHVVVRYFSAPGRHV